MKTTSNATQAVVAISTDATGRLLANASIRRATL